MNGEQVSTPLSENVQIGPKVSILCGHHSPLTLLGMEFTRTSQVATGVLLHDDITELVDVRDLALLHLPFEDAPQMLNRV